MSIKKFFSSSLNNYIFIYTPPKVGSTTLVSSLRISLGNIFNIIHIHDEIMLEVLTGIRGVKINDILTQLSNAGKNVYVIDVYRTSIERKISEFFEKISCYHFNNSEENINHYPVSKIINRFNKMFPYIGNSDHYLEKYNIKEPIAFDFDQKYTLQTVNNINYIKLRLCDSNEWSNILSNIFKREVVIVTDYQTEDKKISELYKKFKNEYLLPSNYLESIENCKYLKYYYNETERLEYLNTWKNKLCDPFVAYTREEFNFYMEICLENQYINDIQKEHYMDEGCICSNCSVKRQTVFKKIKNGEYTKEKIIHAEVKKEKIKNVINEIIQKEKKTNTKMKIFYT
jgi:hypothetical protein